MPRITIEDARAQGFHIVNEKTRPGGYKKDGQRVELLTHLEAQLLQALERAKFALSCAERFLVGHRSQHLGVIPVGTMSFVESAIGAADREKPAHKPAESMASAFTSGFCRGYDIAQAIKAGKPLAPPLLHTPQLPDPLGCLQCPRPIDCGRHAHDGAWICTLRACQAPRRGA